MDGITLNLDAAGLRKLAVEVGLGLGIGVGAGLGVMLLILKAVEFAAGMIL